METRKSQWEYIYQSIPSNQIPWETGEPSFDLVELFENKTLKKGMKILDVGCGLGTQTRYMASQGLSPTGIDISETAIKKAREQLLKDTVDADFVVGDVTKMPFPDGSFDFVYDRGCYHHLTPEQRNDYVREVSRILNSQGSLQMLVFTGTINAIEVIELFLPSFQVAHAYEEIIVDHTNDYQELPVHILRFRKTA